MNCENEFIAKRDQAVDLIIRLNEKKSKLDERELNLDNEILTKATELTDAAELEMQEELDKKVNEIAWKYEQKKNAIYGVTTGAVIYGFVITVYKMLSSVRMRSDLSAFFKGIYYFIVSVIVNNKELLIEIWSPKDNAENSAGSIAVHIALTILLIAIQLVISGFVGWGVYVLSKWAYYSDMFDFVMVMVMLISMASIVWIADKLTFISWNLVLVWIIIQLGIIMTRVTVEYFLI